MSEPSRSTCAARTSSKGTRGRVRLSGCGDGRLCCRVSRRPFLSAGGGFAYQTLGVEFGQVVVPVLVLVDAEPIEIVPAKKARRVHVVEHELDGIIADRLDADDHDVFLARHRLA